MKCMRLLNSGIIVCIFNWFHSSVWKGFQFNNIPRKKKQKSHRIYIVFLIYEVAFALISSDRHREEEKKNIPRKFLFGFPGDQPWYCVIMAGLLRRVQSFCAGPGTMVTVWCSVCGLSLLLMKETQQQLPSCTLFGFSLLKIMRKHSPSASITCRVFEPLVSSTTLDVAMIHNERNLVLEFLQCNLLLSEKIFSFARKRLDVKISRPTCAVISMWQQA